MKADTYVSIVVENSRIVAVRGYKEEGQIIVDEVFEDTINPKEDITKEILGFLEWKNIKKENICICMKDEFKTTFEQTPVMTRSEIRDMLDFAQEHYKGWKEPCYMQYISRDPSLYSDELDMMDLFIVSLTKKNVRNCAKGVMSSKNYIDIITFWPGELNRLYEERRFPVSVRLTDKKAYIYVWDDLMLVRDKEIPLNGALLAKELEALDDEIRAYNDNGLEGLHFVYDDEGQASIRQKIDKVIGEELEPLYEMFGKAEMKNIHYVCSVEALMDKDNITWATAIGGLIRGLCIEE